MTESSRDENVAQYRPSVWFAVRRAVADFYDRLGLTVAASLFMLAPVYALGLIVFPFLSAERLAQARSVALLIFVLLSLIWIGIGAAATMLLARRISYFEDPGPDVFRDTFRRIGLVLKLAAVQIAVTMVLVADAGFFLAMPGFGLKVIGIVLAYLLLFWLMSAMWHWPFFFGGDGKVMPILKRSALITLDNVSFTLGTFFVTMLAGVVLFVTQFGALVVLGGLISCLVTRAHRELLKKYALVEDLPEVIADDGWPAADGPPRRLNPRDTSKGV